MNRDEFSQWIDYHGACFGGFSDWVLGLSRNPRIPNEPQEIADMREDAWFETLGHLGLEECRRLSQRLLKLPNDQKPGGFSEHPAAILELARSSVANEQFRPDFIRYAYHCGLCHDSGMVNVRCKPGFETLTLGGLPMRGKWFEAACPCPAGAPLENRERLKLPRYDRDRMETLYEHREALLAGSDMQALLRDMLNSDNELQRALADRFAGAMRGRVRPVPVAGYLAGSM